MSEQAKHTPGPWEVVADAGQSVSPRDGYLVRWVDGFGVECDVAWVRPVPMLGAGEVRANANLIAAAPDLLEALLRMRDEVREFLPNVCGDALTEAEAAIAKARGDR